MLSKENKRKINKRILLSALIAIILLFIFSGFILFHLFIGIEEVEEKKKTLDELRKTIKEKSFLEQTLIIFENNYGIAINFIIPIFGTIIMLIILYNTAEILAADIWFNPEITPEQIAFLLPIIYILSLYGFLEFLGYSLASLQSFYLLFSGINSIKKRKIEIFISEIKLTIIIIFIIAMIIFIAATIESILISIS